MYLSIQYDNSVTVQDFLSKNVFSSGQKWRDFAELSTFSLGHVMFLWFIYSFPRVMNSGLYIFFSIRLQIILVTNYI